MVTKFVYFRKLPMILLIKTSKGGGVSYYDVLMNESARSLWLLTRYFLFN